MLIRVADGGIMWSKQYWVPKRNWLCGGFTFFYHLTKIPPLGGYDMILGMDWLESHRPMSAHWAHIWMELEHCQHQVDLQGVLPKVLTCHSVMTSFATGFSDKGLFG